MSLIDHKLDHKKCLRSNSFSDRICDDLCQHILHYLSLEDKIRYECVSKQFQRTIFFSIKKLIIDFDDNQWLNKLEIILRRFPSITRIESTETVDLIPSLNRNRSDDNKAIHLIVKYCHSVTHFDTFFDDISEDICLEFMQKFGSNLMTANFYCDTFLKTFLFNRRVSDIEKLSVHSFNSQLNGIQFNKLKSFQIFSLEDEDTDQLKVFFERNRTTLRYLTINSLLSEDMDTTQTTDKRLLDLIPILSNLLHLGFFSIRGLNDKTLEKPLKQISLKCPQIKSIECRYLLDLKGFTTNEELLSPLRQFKRLKRLKLEVINYDFSFRHLKESIDLFTFDAFKGLQELSHLKIDFLNQIFEPISETILTGIDTNLPKLKFFEFDVKLTATQWTAHLLSRLSDLESIDLYIKDESFFIPNCLKVYENCKRIARIVLNGKTIQSFN